MGLIFEYLDFDDLYNFLKSNRVLYSYFQDPDFHFKRKTCIINNSNLRAINKFPEWKIMAEAIILESNNINIFDKFNKKSFRKLTIYSNITNFKFLSRFSNLKSLKLEGYYDRPFTSLPTNIDEILVGNGYNQDINEFKYLQKLKKISFGYIFNKEISLKLLQCLPYLKVICLENCYSQNISPLLRFKDLCILSKCSKSKTVNLLKNDNLENVKYIRLSNLTIQSYFKLN